MQLYKDKTAENRAGSFFSGEGRAKSFFPKENTSEQAFRLQSAGTFDVLSGRTSIVQLCSFDPSCTHPDPCPVHNTYTQATDPTMRRHMRKGESYVGQRAMEIQLRGETPPSGFVRAKAYEGSALHEVIPTNYAAMVAQDQITGMIGGQSGIRTSTRMTFFSSGSPGSPQISAHSGALREKGKPNAFVLTENQAPVHNKLRDAYDEIASEYDPSARSASDEASFNAARMLHSMISTQAPGQVISSAMLPQINSLGRPVISNLTGNRLDSADDVNELASAVDHAREEVKHRYVDFCRARSITGYRSPSPPRIPLRPDGSGGGYSGLQYTLRPFPYCEDPRYPGDIERRTANETAYVTQPLRDYGRYYTPPPRKK